MLVRGRVDHLTRNVGTIACNGDLVAMLEKRNCFQSLIFFINLALGSLFSDYKFTVSCRRNIWKFWNGGFRAWKILEGG